MVDLIVIVFWHAHALNMPFPIGYRRESNISENWREQSYVLAYAHTIVDSFFADRKTIIPDKASTDT